MQVAKWGNSLAVRLPANVVKSLNLKIGDDIEIVSADTNSLHVKKKRSIEEIIKDLEGFRGNLPNDFASDPEFSREKLHER